jgi:adenine-specific DNA-methyltransferase
MRYIGSKGSTVESVYALISDRLPSGSFCDPFGGIGIVGAYFKRNGYTVWSGDLLTFAHFFQVATIVAGSEPKFRKLCINLGLPDVRQLADYLNSLSPMHGWLVREYAEQRRFFTISNAARIEAIYHSIIQWAEEGLVNDMETAILKASLINSMDRVANTAGTYYAYLKTWYRKAKKDFCFDLLLGTPGAPVCQSFQCEASDLVSMRHYDILYLDPPYNDRNYASYYHLPETIARGETPMVHGLAGVPNTLRPISDFNRASKAYQALVELLDLARFRLLAFHYSDLGLITPDQVRSLLVSYGQVEEFSLNSIGYSTSHCSRTVPHRLYLVTHA